MSLEEIVAIYGYNDYFDSNSMLTFHLGDSSVKMQKMLGFSELTIPVSDGLTGAIIGTCTMENV